MCHEQVYWKSSFSLARGLARVPNMTEGCLSTAHKTLACFFYLSKQSSFFLQFYWNMCKIAHILMINNTFLFFKHYVLEGGKGIG